MRCPYIAPLLAGTFLVSCAPIEKDLSSEARSGGALAGSSRPNWPGKNSDGSVLLPNQWSLRPVGRQVPLGDFPINIAVHSGGRFAAVLHTGYGDHEILIVNLSSGKVVSRTKIHEAFYGLEFSADGRRLYCSGAGDEVVHQFEFQAGNLIGHQEIELRAIREKGVPAGLVVNRAESHLFVANVWGNSFSKIELGDDPQVFDFPLSGTNTSIAEPAPIPSVDPDTAAAEKRSLVAAETNKGGIFPYACRLDEERKRLYLSLWAQAAVDVIDLASERIVDRWKAEDHPCEMVLTRSGDFLFVANASRNTVTVFETASGKTVETICAALYPQAPPGSTPNSVALSPDDHTLFVANADNNFVAVFDVSNPGKSRSLGFIPVGWYPTSVRVTPDGKHLLVANGKGVTPLANPLGPQPGVTFSTNSIVQYIAGLFRGTLSIISLPARKKFEQRLQTWTAQAYRCSPLKPDSSVSALRPGDNPIPARPGDPSPIKYCIYIIKENRTYDQVLGDMPEGKGDPKLCLFPERVTPNLHRIARDFVLLDNFYVESEVSADGHEWSMGAYATDFVEKMWPLDYGHNRSGKFPYPSEGNFPIATPAGGYLWDRARAAGVSYRSYGEFVSNGRTLEKPAHTRVKALEGHFDEWFRGFDLDYWDTNRAARFISELNRFERAGDMPRLQILRLPNDHTHGTTVGFRTPTAYVADNDLAMGMVIEAISHSRFWPQTAVFVVEDDAQNGPDHVDAHRTTAYVISPYTKRGAVDSSMYSTSSMLRTMELILGLQPMSQFDAAARPMFNSFQARPDLRPYQALGPRVDLEELNERRAWGSNLKMDFAREDAADDLLLNEAVWRSVRGADSPMPAPVRAGFVFAHSKAEDGD
jgi:WD40 repeat protein